MDLIETILPFATPVVTAAVAAVVAFVAGRRLRVAKLKLPLIDFDLIDKEAPDRFSELSMVMAETSFADHQRVAKLAKEGKADLLIHFGWHLVCDTFVEKHRAYPTDEALQAAIADLGAQNIEFITIYRTTYERNVLGGGDRRVDPDYALNYFSRALTLAERIDPAARAKLKPRIDKLLEKLSVPEA